MTKATRNTVPPIMLVMLPPEAAQLVVDHLIQTDRSLAKDLAAIRRKYEPRATAAEPPRRSRASVPATAA